MRQSHALSVTNLADDAVPLPPPTLASGDDPAGYDRLAARVAAAVAPKDALEEIWVRDVVDLSWDVLRLRRLKAHLFTIGASDGMAKLLPAIGEWWHKARGWAARDPAVVAAVNAKLSAAGLDADAVTTSTFMARIDEFERIERMLAAAEARRAAALHEIAGYRAALAQRLRAATQAAEIADGEFAEVAPAAAPQAQPA